MPSMSWMSRMAAVSPMNSLGTMMVERGGFMYTAHVDIPAEVEEAFERLSRKYAVRAANPMYATK